MLASECWLTRQSLANCRLSVRYSTAVTQETTTAPMQDSSLLWNSKLIKRPKHWVHTSMRPSVAPASVLTQTNKVMHRGARDSRLSINAPGDMQHLSIRVHGPNHDAVPIIPQGTSSCALVPLNLNRLQRIANFQRTGPPLHPILLQASPQTYSRLVWSRSPASLIL